MSRFPMRLAALTILLALVAPTASAFQTLPCRPVNWEKCLPPTQGIPGPGWGIPCVTVNVSVELPPAAGGGTRQVNASNAHVGCSFPSVDLQWNATAFRGRGAVVFTFDPADAESGPANGTFDPGDVGSPPNVTVQSSDVQPVGLSPLAALLDALSPPASEPRLLDSPLPSLPRTVVTVSLDVAWGSGCGDLRGTFVAKVNDETLPANAPTGLFADLCGLGSAPEPATFLRATEAVLVLAQGLAPSVPAPDFHALAQGLAALLPAIAPPAEPAPPIPSAPDTDDGGQAVGNATLVLFDADALAAEAHDVVVETPLGGAEAHGGESVVLPGFAPAPVSSASRAPTTLAPAAPPPAGSPTPRGSTPLPEAAPSGGTTVTPRTSDSLVHLHGAGDPTPGSAAARAVALATILASAGALLLAFFTLYPRFSKPAALRHAGRAALLRACQESGRGMTAGELAAAVGMRRQTAEYHLRYLVRLGHLRLDEEPDGPARFAIHAAAPAPGSAAAPLHEALLARIRARPGASTRELARELGVTRRRVDRRVKDFLTRGIVQSRIEGGERRLYPA